MTHDETLQRAKKLYNAFQECEEIVKVTDHMFDTPGGQYRYYALWMLLMVGLIKEAMIDPV